MWRRLWFVGMALGFVCRLGAQGFVWTTHIGLIGSPAGDKVAVDASGNVYVTGGFQGTAYFGNTNLASAGGGDVFLAKYDGSGNLVWVKQSGSASEDAGADVAVDTNGNVYVVGSFQGTATFDNTNLTAAGSMSIGTVANLFLAKYSPTGTLIWVRQAGGPGGGAGLGIAVDTDGNVFSTGYYRNFSGWYSIVIDKRNASGDPLWHQEIAGLPNYYSGLQGTSIKVDGVGNVYVTGVFATQVTMGTNTLQSPGNSGGALFITKLDPNGNFIWAEQPGLAEVPNFNVGYSIALDGLGNLFVAGNYGGTLAFGTNRLITSSSLFANGFVVKCDGDGHYLWARQTLRRNGGGCSSVAVDSGGNVYVTGVLSFSDVFLDKYDANGDLLWELTPNHNPFAPTAGYATAADSSNRVYLVTLANGDIAFDSILFTNIVGTDLFVSQVSEQLPPVFVTQPQNSATSLSGGSYSLNASTRSVYPVSYQWRFNRTKLDGATNALLTITNTQFSDQGNYDLIASNLYGSSTSLVANLTVNFTITLVIQGNGNGSINPSGMSSYPGNSVISLAAETNVANPFIGWSGDISGTDYMISTLITTNLYVAAAFADSITNIIIDNIDRRASFSGGWSLDSTYGQYANNYEFTACSTSANANVVYRPVIVVPGYYDVFVWYPQYGYFLGFTTNAPWSVVCDSGSILTSIDETTNGGGWLLIASGMSFSEGTNGLVSLSNATGESSQTVVIADAVRFRPSQPPTINANPQSQTVKSGSNVTFSVGISGSPPFSYQWEFNSTNLPNANGSSLTITQVQPSHAGNYLVNVSNFLGNATSSNALLAVTAPSQPLLGSPTNNSNGQFQMSLRGDLGVTFAIETSTNLTDWVSLADLINTTENTTVFTDTFNTNGADKARFYRARWLPR